MKLFLKIVFFIFTMIFVIVGDVKSSTVIAILQEDISYSFYQESQHFGINFENHNANSCLNEKNAIAYSERVTSTNAIVAKGGDDLLSFMSKSLSQKLDEIATIWKTQYPIDEMLGGRTFFEKIMREYRYTKATGWEHTADLASNFRGVDFYRGTENVIGIIEAETAVSMKTTITTDVNVWLRSKPIQDNIDFLKQGLNPIRGIESNQKVMFIKNAEIHIYMPKENITPQLKAEWLNKLNTVDSQIKFEIYDLESFVK